MATDIITLEEGRRIFKGQLISDEERYLKGKVLKDFGRIWISNIACMTLPGPAEWHGKGQVPKYLACDITYEKVHPGPRVGPSTVRVDVDDVDVAGDIIRVTTKFHTPFIQMANKNPHICKVVETKLDNGFVVRTLFCRLI